MMKRIFNWLLNLFRRLFHRSIVKVIPFKATDRPSWKGRGLSRSMIVRAGSSMRRGRLLGVR